MIEIICAWCGRHLGQKDGAGSSGVSHGVCPECYQKLMEDGDNARRNP